MACFLVYDIFQFLPSRPISDTHALPIEISTNCTKGLALIAPVLGLPLLLHAVTGAVVGCLGVTEVAVLISPLAGKVLPAVKTSDIEIPPARDLAGNNASIHDSIRVTPSDDVV